MYYQLMHIFFSSGHTSQNMPVISCHLLNLNMHQEPGKELHPLIYILRRQVLYGGVLDTLF